MKKIILLSSIVALAINVMAYTSIAVEGYSWNVVNRNASMDDSNSINYKTIKQKFEGDSIINDVTYKKLWQSTDNELADGR